MFDRFLGKLTADEPEITYYTEDNQLESPKRVTGNTSKSSR
jgi:hypothetical protein